MTMSKHPLATPTPRCNPARAACKYHGGGYKGLGGRLLGTFPGSKLGASVWERWELPKSGDPTSRFWGCCKLRSEGMHTYHTTCTEIRRPLSRVDASLFPSRLAPSSSLERARPPAKKTSCPNLMLDSSAVCMLSCYWAYVSVQAERKGQAVLFDYTWDRAFAGTYTLL
jgi:hypothetical protein